MSSLIELIKNYIYQQKELGETEFYFFTESSDSLLLNDMKDKKKIDKKTEETNKKIEKSSNVSIPISQNIEINKVVKQDNIITNKETTIIEQTSLFGEPKTTVTTHIKADLPWFTSNSLDELYNKIKDCHSCALGDTRIKFVFGDGNPNAKLIFIGEAPGADEDKQGIPFVGRAGQLLNKILGRIGLKREDVYIANILKCRPPGNRVPLPDEVMKCEPYLLEQLRLIQPKVICTLGLTATQNLLGTKQSMGNLRGKVHYYHNIPVVPTYHPAAILRTPSYEEPTVVDLQFVKQLYDAQ
jgi:DNA polymerase